MILMGCLNCGRCCTSFGVCITPNDLKRICTATKLQASDIATLTPADPEREREEPSILIDGVPMLLILKWKKAHDCIFYSRNERSTAGCSIYSVRPMLCRTYPFRLRWGRLHSFVSGSESRVPSSEACVLFVDVKSRVCPRLWPAEDSYLPDLKKYEAELAYYCALAAKWNSLENTKRKRTFEEFLNFVL